MPKNTIIENGVLHNLPEDLETAMLGNTALIEKWNNLTAIARNEWICWTTIVKKPQTRIQHIERLCTEILQGKKRPCCWPGCPHTNPNAKKWFKDKK